MLLYLGRCAVATVHVAVEAPSFLSLQSCTRTLDRLYASTRSVNAKWYWVNHGRLTSERKAYLPLPIVTHQSLDPAARALKRQASCLLRGLTSEQSCTRTLDRQRTIMHSNTRQALNASTRSVYAKWYWVNHGRLTSERQAHQRMQSLPSATHRHSSITRPCCSSAQAPSFLSFTRRRSRRAVEVILCMITRDFSVISIDVTCVSLSPSTTHKSHSRTI